jgi:hypothetical protein
MRPFKIGDMFRVAIVALLLIFAVPFDAWAQDRDRRSDEREDKKCEKFVNCHDARDGRVDGRGPRRRTVSWDDRDRRDHRFSHKYGRRRYRHHLFERTRNRDDRRWNRQWRRN